MRGLQLNAPTDARHTVGHSALHSGGTQAERPALTGCRRSAATKAVRVERLVRPIFYVSSNLARDVDA